MLSNSILKAGDWVKGISREGELFLGYIDSFIYPEVVKVTVISSDNPGTVGKTIPLLRKQVKKLPESKAINKEQILYLIDLALATGDEEWFLELTAKLNTIQQLVQGITIV